MPTEPKEPDVVTGQQVTYGIDWNVPEETQTFYANEMALQVLHTEFILSFFEVRIPLASPVAKENIAKGRCVARVALSVERIPAILQTLERNLNSYLEKRASGEVIDEVENDVE